MQWMTSSVQAQIQAAYDTCSAGSLFMASESPAEPGPASGVLEQFSHSGHSSTRYPHHLPLPRGSYTATKVGCACRTPLLIDALAIAAPEALIVFPAQNRAVATMAKSKNHTNHNQGHKNHKNGIKKPNLGQKRATRGVRPPRLLAHARLSAGSGHHA